MATCFSTVTINVTWSWTFRRGCILRQWTISTVHSWRPTIFMQITENSILRIIFSSYRVIVRSYINSWLCVRSHGKLGSHHIPRDEHPLWPHRGVRQQQATCVSSSGTWGRPHGTSLFQLCIYFVRIVPCSHVSYLVFLFVSRNDTFVVCFRFDFTNIRKSKYWRHWRLSTVKSTEDTLQTYSILEILT